MAGSASKLLSIFYGYPDWLIAEWCGVSVATARAYKSGRRRPSRPVVTLFLLHRERRVLGSEWKGWIVKKDRLVSEDDHEFTEAQLRGYFWIMQLAWRLAYDSKDANVIGEFEKLLRA